MQHTATEPLLAFPNGAAAAYGNIIRHTENARAIEYRLFEKVTASLEAAASDSAGFPARIQAAHDNRTLWQSLAHDLAGEDNTLPPDLRARLISLAIWVTRETERVIHHGAALRDLIDINRSIMPGLKPAEQGAA